tara:strand:- start:950 stop:1366 length:417 start_codon:yes stop_codon:yes gene_type:complete
MDFKFIDYSLIYYGVITKSLLPEKRFGKFVQVRDTHNEVEYFIMAPADLSKYHANIVERFCSLHNPEIPGEYNAEHDHYVIYDDEFVVRGGGKWEIDDSIKTLRMFGFSKAYGSFDSEGLKENLLKVDILSGYRVQTD